MQQSSHSVKPISRGLLVVAAMALVASLFVPIWRIELAAPQYPEGLALLISANKIGGDVEIINGLNHYIGMQTLHTENFIEFSILIYIISAYALATLLVAFIAKRKAVLTLFVCFILFGILAMIDFYRWNYNYGHNLDPNAAIQVPGMAYQPPLIGYKQLLNFGAFSIPDIGGWLFIIAGSILAFVVVLEYNLFKKGKQSVYIMLFGALISMHSSCAKKGPVPIKLNTDQCDFCMMTITDAKYGCELLTTKGRIYKFDDVVCMKRYLKENKNQQGTTYVADFLHPEKFIPTTEAFFVKSDAVKSPMGGQIAAFSEHNEALKLQQQLQATLVTWED